MPTAHGRALGDLLPGSEYREIPGARALPMLERPRETAEIVSAFRVGRC